jgi:hypothetical protein
MTLSNNAIALLKSLLYYDVFKHPLKAEEMAPYSSGHVQNDLEFLCQNKFINQHKGFYYLGNDESIISKRIKGTRLARKYLEKVHVHAKWISKLPFVRCICISGSLSKYYMGEKSDVDYFIITDSDRLWIVRFVLTVICKSLSLLRAKKYLCPNYIIANDDLEIKDKNIFTATEIATLLPLYNYSAYHDFLDANGWIKDYVPHFEPKEDGTLSGTIKESSKHSLFTKTNDFLFQLYSSHYRRKFAFAFVGDTTFKIIVEKKCYKFHCTPGHRNKILDKFEENVRNYETKFDVQLSFQPVFN